MLIQGTEKAKTCGNGLIFPVLKTKIKNYFYICSLDEHL